MISLSIFIYSSKTIVHNYPALHKYNTANPVRIFSNVVMAQAVSKSDCVTSWYPPLPLPHMAHHIPLASHSYSNSAFLLIVVVDRYGIGGMAYPSVTVCSMPYHLLRRRGCGMKRGMKRFSKVSIRCSKNNALPQYPKLQHQRLIHVRAFEGG